MNQIDLKGRVAVITGGARGMGFACAQRFIDSGARVALWDLDGDAITARRCQPWSTARGFVVDVANEGGINAARQSTLEAFGQIDIVVNNAGITGPNVKTWEYPAGRFPPRRRDRSGGALSVSRALVPHMIERGYGRIVNIASVAGKEGT